MRYVAIGLKIPDNTAYTALTALRRLGVDVHRIERDEIRPCGGDEEDPAVLAARMERDESIFNPNKHRLRVLEHAAPREGEVWIRLRGDAEPGSGKEATIVGWRLFGSDGAPAPQETLKAAAERLLCNAAIEDALFPERLSER